MHSDPTRWRIGLVGYGEVGRILAEDLRAAGVEVGAYDVKLGGPGEAPLREHAARVGVALASSSAELAARCDLVVSAVTASQAVPVAQACAPALPSGSYLLDLNSASPGAKGRAADVVDAAGGRYVEAAVMTSVPPHRIAVPMLLGGPHAALLQPALIELGFAATVQDERVGVASATKMCRSVMIKGLEAILVESLTAARAHGVEDEVVASLAETYPGMDWEKLATYCFQRVIEHGRRRAEEMREVAATVAEAGLTPWSAEATANRQEWMADLADAGVFGPRGEPGFARSPDWRVEADRLRVAADRPRHEWADPPHQQRTEIEE